MKILAIGPLWRGSNAGGLFRAMSREGCLIDIVDEFYFISLQTKTKLNKILERVIRPLQMAEFNNVINKVLGVIDVIEDSKVKISQILKPTEKKVEKLKRDINEKQRKLDRLVEKQNEGGKTEKLSLTKEKNIELIPEDELLKIQAIEALVEKRIKSLVESLSAAKYKS